MAVKVRIDWRAVLNGAVLAVALVVPTVLAIQVVNAAIGISDHSNFWFFGYALIFVEMALGGGRAADRRPEAPALHGALAALSAYGPVAAIVVAVGVATSESPGQVGQILVAVLFGAFTFASAGVLGGLVATRPGRRRRSSGPRRRAPEQ